MTARIIAGVLGVMMFVSTAVAAEPASMPATTQVAVKVTPEAAAVVAKVSDAYLKLKSLALAGKMTGEFDIAGQKKSESADFVSNFAAPNQFRHEIKNEEVLGSTGKKLYVYTMSRNIYLMSDAPDAKVASQELPDPFAQLVGSQNLSLALAIAKDPAVEMTKPHAQVTKADDVKVDDKTYTALNLLNQKGDLVATLLIDPATHLLRRATMDLSSDIIAQGATDVKKATIVVDYTSTKADEPTKPDQFAWAPPTGAKDLNEAPAADAGDEAAKQLKGKPAPAFKLKDLEGKEVVLTELKGSVVVLDFWATWCGPCVGALPHLDKLYQDKKGEGLKVFAVNQAEDRELVQGFMKSKNLSVPVLLDGDSKVGELYKAQAIPETVVVGKDGTVKEVFVGAGPGTEKELRQAVEAAMKAAK